MIYTKIFWAIGMICWIILFLVERHKNKKLREENNILSQTLWATDLIAKKTTNNFLAWKPIDVEQPEDNKECYIAIQSNITHEIYVEGARYDKGKWVLKIPRYYDEVLDPDHETVLAWQYKKIPKYYGEWRKE